MVILGFLPFFWLCAFLHGGLPYLTQDFFNYIFLFPPFVQRQRRFDDELGLGWTWYGKKDYALASRLNGTEWDCGIWEDIEGSLCSLLPQDLDGCRRLEYRYFVTDVMVEGL